MTRFSIVIPTLNRSKYLFSTLKSIIEQDYDDYEIIVADNNSIDDTKKVIDQFNSKKIKYHRSNISLSRNQNWNFGLSKSTGNFITFIGDDDAFFPKSLTLLDDIILKYKVDVINWYKANYHWPDHLINERKNIFEIRSKSIINIVKSQSKFNLFVNFKDRYSALPCIYNSLIHRRYIDQVINLSEKKLFFQGVIPDVYSGIILSKVIKNYAQLYFPITLNGASKLSGGVLQGQRIKKISEIENEQIKDISKESLKKKYDNRIGSSTSIYSIELGEYLIAANNYPKLEWPKPKWKKYIGALKRELSHPRCKNFEEILNSAKYTANKIGINFKYKKKRNLTVADQSNYNFNCNIFVSEKYVKNSYDASSFLKILPEISQIQNQSIKFLLLNWLSETKELLKLIMRIFLSR